MIQIFNEQSELFAEKDVSNLIKKNNYFLKLMVHLFAIAVYIFYISKINFYNLNQGYYVTLFLPITYIFCSYFFLWDPVISIRTPFLVLFNGVSFVRYVLLSISTLNNNGYAGLSGVPVSNESLNIAGHLMLWELIVISFFIKFWYKKKFSYAFQKEKQLESDANIYVYLLSFVIASILILIIPQAQQGLSFFGSINSSMRDEIGSLFLLGIRELFINSKYFFLFFVIIALQRKNGLNLYKNQKISYLIIFIVIVLVIGLRIGSNRKKLLADSISALLLLWNLFPKFKKRSSILILSIALMLVAVTTVYRGMTSSPETFFNQYFDVDTLQTYFLGQYNVGIAIEAKDLFSNQITMRNFMLSLLRPIFGIGSLIKNIEFSRLDSLFDMRMSMGINGFRGDQILPIIGEGYMLFGFLFSPILLICISRLGLFFDELYANSKKIEIVFLASVVSFYLAQGMILNTTIILNMLSFRLAIYLPIAFLGRIFSRQKIYTSESIEKIIM